ncbi:hypothetical protein HU200_049255 [Digitaria exilis]|uniref:MATH domain-containing protein n=1 Tax=Digitaria exilis TaxID=1010633 RepID=A0A835B4J7_9POAL|nr:hypothetical protein HU200_049255 [Digitaria exilis]
MSFAGVSLIGDDGEASRSTSTWDTAADSSDIGYHLFVVRRYSRTKDTPNGKCIDSQQFRVGGYRWHIEYFPNGCDDDHTDCICFYLSLDDDGHTGEHATLQFEFSFIDQVDRQDASRIRAMRGWKLESDCCWGYSGFVNRSVFELSSTHLKNDSFTVRCDVVVTTKNASNTDRSSSSSVVVSPPPSIQQDLISSLLLPGEGTDVAFEDSLHISAVLVLCAEEECWKMELANIIFV